MTGRAAGPRAFGVGASPDDGLFGRTLSALKWAFLTSFGQALMSLGFVTVLARLLAPEDFGRLAFALIFIALANTIVQRGLGPALIQRFELTRRHLATGFALSSSTGLVLGAVLWGLAPWLSGLIGDPETARLLRLLCLGTVVGGLGVASEHRLRRELRFRELMGATILANGIGNGLVAIALALLGHGVWALAWGALARVAVFAVAVIGLAPPPGRLAAGRREAGDLLRTGVGFSAVALLNSLSVQAVGLVIARTLGAASLGLYTRAQALSVLPARLSPVLSNVLLPAMARRQHRVERLRTVYLNGTELFSLGALPASLLIAVCAPQIVAVVLGPQWSEAAPALRILALAGAVRVFNALHTPAIRSLGAVYRESWRRALYLLVLTGGAWIGSRWGLPGVAVAVGAAQILLQGLLTHLALGLLGIGWTRLLARHVTGLWASAWAAVALALTAGAVGAADWPAPLALAAHVAAWAAAAGGAVYLAPRFAAPAFPHWGLGRLPLEGMGAVGRRARAALEHLARRWPDRKIEKKS